MHLLSMDYTTIEQLVEICTVRIKTSSNGHGTGFFIVPGHIITCAHVLGHSANEEIVFCSKGSSKYLPAKLIYSFAPEADLAILQAKRVKHLCGVYIGHEVAPRDTCFTFGYTDSDQGHPDGDPVTLECEGLAGKQGIIIKLKGGQVRPGMSGAPLLNQKTGKVCGIVSHSRHTEVDLGGEAVSINILLEKLPQLREVHDEFHQKHSEWRDFLQEDIEPFPSDWMRLNRRDKKWASYLKALYFLVSVLFKWMILGFQAPRAFPIETINLLIKHTLTGDLGQEINRQRKELVKNLTKIDREVGGQARIINQLESKASVLSELITILIPESQNLASSSRLLWAVELIYQQQDLLNELKEIEGNSYPALEKWKNKFGFLKTGSDRRYREVDKIINRLLLKYSDHNYKFQEYLYPILWDLISFMSENIRMSIFISDKIIDYVKGLFLQLEEHRLKDQSSDEDADYAVLVKSVLEELEKDIKKHPHLKVLSKTKVLLENVAGKPIIGGPYRAWKSSKSKNKYHFSRQCKFYPERARPYEMARISCYNSHEEARKNHEPCKTCMNAENMEATNLMED